MSVSSVRTFFLTDSTRFGRKFKPLPKKSIDLRDTHEHEPQEREALRSRVTQLVRATLLQNYKKHLQELAKPAHKTMAVTYGDVLQALSAEHRPLKAISDLVGLSPKDTQKALKHLKEMGLVEQPHVFKFVRRSAFSALYKMLHAQVAHFSPEYNLGEKQEKVPFLKKLNDVRTGYRVNRYGFVAADLWKDRTNPEIAPVFEQSSNLLQKWRQKWLA